MGPAVGLFGAARCDLLPLLSFREENAGHGRMQCLPDSALRERHPTDPAMIEADAEPSRVEVQADKRCKVNLLPDAYLHESLFDLKQCEILFGYHEVLRRACAFDGSQDSLVDQGAQIASASTLGRQRQVENCTCPVSAKSQRTQEHLKQRGSCSLVWQGNFDLFTEPGEHGGIDLVRTIRSADQKDSLRIAQEPVEFLQELCRDFLADAIVVRSAGRADCVQLINEEQGWLLGPSLGKN